MPWLPIGELPERKRALRGVACIFVLQSKGNVAGEAKHF